MNYKQKSYRVSEGHASMKLGDVLERKQFYVVCNDGEEGDGWFSGMGVRGSLIIGDGASWDVIEGS